MSSVRFFYADVKPIKLRRKRLIHSFVQAIFIEEMMELEALTYIFCSDGYILDINTKFLQHSFYTDIITFDLGTKDAINGEIYISIDTVKSNSDQFQVSFDEELKRVIFHGALHLCGYKDKTKSEKKLMRQKEDYYLLKFSQNKIGCST